MGIYFFKLNENIRTPPKMKQFLTLLTLAAVALAKKGKDEVECTAPKVQNAAKDACVCEPCADATHTQDEACACTPPAAPAEEPAAETCAKTPETCAADAAKMDDDAAEEPAAGSRRLEGEEAAAEEPAAEEAAAEEPAKEEAAGNGWTVDENCECVQGASQLAAAALAIAATM